MNHDELKEFITETFYWCHRHPELSFKEFATTEHIRQALEKADIRILQLPLETGLAAQVGTGSKPIVAVRCDIDALPVTEETDLSYHSETPGCMHACGHDFHTAAILGAAYLLKEKEKEIKGTIRIIFQPGEEGPSGALKIVHTGIIDDVQAIFGMHCTPLLEVGKAGFVYGPAMAAVDAFKITFEGKGVHAARPHEGVDSIVTAAAFVSAVQSIVSRNMNPFTANLVSVTHIEGGKNWNVLPKSTFVEGTTRAMSREDRAKVKKRVAEIARQTASVYNAAAEVEWLEGPPALCNDAAWGDFAKKIAKQHGFDIEDMQPSLGGEDFAFYFEKTSGFFVMMGTGLSYPNHNPKFKVDPQALYPAASYMADLAVQAVRHLGD